MLKGKGTFTIDQQEVMVEESDIVFANEDKELGFINDSQENTSIYVMLHRLSKTD